MKIKIVLSISLWLIITLAGCSHLSAREESIALSKIQYAIKHPGTPVVISSKTIVVRSPNWLWETEHIENQMIIYNDCDFSIPFEEITVLPTTFCGFGIFLLILGSIGAFLCMYHRGIWIYFPTIALLEIIFENKNVHWWLPIIVLIIFVIIGWLGNYLKNKKEEKSGKIKC